MVSPTTKFGKRAGAALLVGTVLGGWSAPVLAQQAVPVSTQPQPAPAITTPVQSGIIRSIAVRGNQRLEPETIRAYANLVPGQEYTTETLDTALKALYATELFNDANITGGETGNLVINVQENPVINRIILEGNKRLKEDKILPEIRLKPREIFTRSKVRSDVERIIELYKRQGRFAARVEPKIVNLEQNRVDLVFDIYEGPTSKVRSINIIGNEAFGDDRLRKEMYTRQAGGILGFIKSNDSYDPDRLAADQQKLRAFYLTQGYADFRVVSALADLTPDRRDFVITYVIEEGPRYKFGKVTAQSPLRDLPVDTVTRIAGLQSGEWFNAKAVEDAVTRINEVAGALGYAFADVSPNYERNAEQRVMDITLRVADTQRTYVERIDIAGNTVTRDKVVRREFRVKEGDAFNSMLVKRSKDRIQSLGFFQDELEIKQSDGSSPDRIVLGVDVEEKATGELSLSAGYSSLERLVLSANIAQRNFRGMGQTLNAGINYSQYSKSATLGFLEPYFLDKSIALGGQIYRRDYNSFNFVNNQRNTTYSQTTNGFGLNLGFPINEYMSFGTRYSLNQDKIKLDKGTFYTDPDGATGPEEAVCDPLKAGRYLCDEIGGRLSSNLGYSIVYDNTNGIRATRGQRITVSQDFTGLGGDVRFLRSRADGTKFWGFGGGWIFSAHAEGGYIHPLQEAPGPGRDPIRITDRFFGGQMRGFDIRGIGPRIQRLPYTVTGELDTESGTVSDALGGRAYYMGRLEVEPPTSSGLRSLGLRPSAFVDIGSLWALRQPTLTDIIGVCTSTATENPPAPIILDEPGEQCPATGFTRTGGIKEFFVGNSAKPRLSVGVGVNWVSPFGPLRIDLAKAILKQEGDDTKFFSFNVGTQF